MNIRNFKFEEDPFIKDAQGFSKNCREVLWLLKFLQTKPQGKNMNTNYCYLDYTVIKNRDENEIVDN